MNRQIQKYARDLVKSADITKVYKVSDLDLDVIRKMANEQAVSWEEVEALLQAEIKTRSSRQIVKVLASIIFLILSIVFSVGLVAKSCSMFFGVLSG